MGTADTVTTMTPVMDTTMAVDQGICGVCGVGDKHGLRPLEFALLFVCPDHHLRATSVEPSVTVLISSIDWIGFECAVKDDQEFSHRGG